MSDDRPSLDKLDQLDEITVKRLMRIIKLTREQEYTCMETLVVLDEYVEIVLQRKDPAEWTPLVDHHVELCEECEAEFEALMAIIREEV
jgi:hypothetical protein